MIVTKIENHVEQALARRLYQYKGLPKLTALITALVEQIQDLEDAIFPVAQKRLLYDGTNYVAVGAQLDGIGDLLNLSRNGLNDAQYLILILGTIAENFSDGTTPTIRKLVKILTGATHVEIYDKYPAGYAIELTGETLLFDLWGLVCEIIQKASGAAIQLCYVATYSEVDEPFAFSGGDNGSGFAPWSTDPQTSGGIFVNQVYKLATQVVDYLTDESGNILTDEDGNPLIPG